MMWQYDSDQRQKERKQEHSLKISKRKSSKQSLNQINRKRAGNSALALIPALFLLLTTASAAHADVPAATLSPDKIEFFEKKVRPLLAESCLSCHSAASKPVQGNLRLDTRSGVLKGGDRGPTVTSAKPLDSPLLTAISYKDNNFQMPPKGKLSDEQIAVLTDWVKMGAPFPEASNGADAVGKPKAGAASAGASGVRVFNMKTRMKHWAWQPVHPQLVPAVQQKAWGRNPIDAFVLARLEAKGVKPAPAADKRTIIRRVTYDLIGLPPTPAEVQDFLNDKSPRAYDKLVDRLLASPHYGERWGRHWLDLVRYAETDGHEFDFDKTGAWEYRDYVIRAMNADVPYNQFVQEHLAGDLLPHPRLNPVDHYNESKLGTGFLWLGSGTHSPVDLRDDECSRVDNQIDVVGKAFLGVGIGCARCHDHKFDAISAKDYYALYGFLKSARQEVTAVGPPVDEKLRFKLAGTQADLQQTLLQGAGSALTSKIDLTSPTTAKEWSAPLKEAGTAPANVLYPWTVLNTPDAERSTDAFRKSREDLRKRLQEQADRAQKERQAIIWLLGPDADAVSQGWYASGTAFPSASQTQSARCVLTARPDTEKKNRIAAAYQSPTDSGWVSDKMQGALRSPTFTIDKRFLLYQVIGKETRIRLIIDGFQQIRDPLYGGLQFDINNPTRTAWRVQDVKQYKGHRAYIELADNGNGYLAVPRVGASDSGAPVEAPNPLVLQMLDDSSVTSSELLAHTYEALFHSAGEWLLAGQPDKNPDAASYRALLQEMLPALTLPASTATRLADLLTQRAALEAQLPATQPALVSADGTGENERVHLRGNYRTLGVEAPRRFLEACGGSAVPGPNDGSGRLLLAQRMTAASNPLIARVIVNRLWQHHFGEGIVRTPDDFGVMGQPPTHPELLDWLANNFVQDSEAGQGTNSIRTNAKGQGKGAAASNPYACNWSLKKMHRLMVLSSAYRMSSQSEPKAEAADPQNKLLHKMPVRRLEAEGIRDAILAVSGKLDAKLYGPSVMPHLTAFTIGRGAPPSGPVDGAGRRTIYMSIRRNFPIPLLMAFDYPVPTSTMGHRSVSSVPAQALTLLNDPFVVEQAGVWAKRVLAEPGDATQHINGLYETAFSRPPTEAERNAALAFVTQQGQQSGKPDDPRIWADLCHVLLNVKEFIFIR